MRLLLRRGNGLDVTFIIACLRTASVGVTGLRGSCLGAATVVGVGATVILALGALGRAWERCACTVVGDSRFSTERACDTKVCLPLITNTGSFLVGT